MKRALALTFAALLFGVAGLAQISGSFSGEISLLPKLELDSIELEIGYTVAGFDIKGTSEFDSTGFISQEFSLTGVLGPVDVEGSMSFLPSGEKVLKDISQALTLDAATYGFPADLKFSYQDEKWAIPGPAYLSSELDLSMDFAGITFGLNVKHEANKVITFDEICPALDWFELTYDYDVQTTSDTGTVTYKALEKDWQLGVVGGCCYSKYFVTGDPEVLLAKVTIKGKKGTEDVTYTLEGPFEVAWVDADRLKTDPTHVLLFNPAVTTPVDGLMWTVGWLYDPDGTLDLTVASSTYITDYYMVLLNKEGWTSITAVEYDPKDLFIKFLLPSYMTYTFTAENDIFGIEVIFDDVCTGMQFKEATITLTDLSLCCGITYDAELHFTKCEGFDYAKFSADLFEICCDISFGMDLEFGVDYKKVAPKFSWAGIENCITVWGDVQIDEELKHKITGWELYGFKVHCELAECTYIEFVEAFDVAEVEKIIGDVFEAAKGENEYLKFGFCGPGCCGGTWSLDTSVFFSAEVDPTLFGITRFLVETEVPLMDALSVSLDFGYNVPDAEATLIFGWSFTF